MRTLTHDLVDFAVLLAAHEFLVFIGQLDFDAQLVLSPHHKRDLGDHRHGSLDGIVRAIDGEAKLFKGQLSARVGTNVGQRGSKVGGRRASVGLRQIGLQEPPGRTVELPGLERCQLRAEAIPRKSTRLTNAMISRTVRSTWRISVPCTLTTPR